MTTLALSTAAPHDCGSNVPYGGFGAALDRPSRFSKSVGYGGAVLAGALFFFFPSRRFRGRVRGLLAFFAVCAGICGMASLGCGSSNCTDFGTSPGHYTFKVNGASASATPAATSPTSTDTLNISTNVALSVRP